MIPCSHPLACMFLSELHARHCKPSFLSLHLLYYKKLFPAPQLQHPLPSLHKTRISQEALYMLAVVLLKERRKHKKRALGKLLQIRQAFCIGSIQKLRPLLFLPSRNVEDARATDLAIGQGAKQPRRGGVIECNDGSVSHG